MGFSIAVSAGEASGDLNGACLAAELTKLRGDLHIWGAGGKRMCEAGVEIVVDTTGGGTISISETLKSLPAIAVRYLRLRRELLRRRPDVFVPIDYGAFNVRLGQVIHASGIPVVYYFPPSSWRKNPRNGPKLLACGGRVITPFPWSAERLSDQGVDARFVGHPLVDHVKPSVDKQTFLGEMGLSDSTPLIGLFPGSRKHELSEHLDRMLYAAEMIHREMPGAQFVIGAAHGAGEIRARTEAIAGARKGFPVVRVAEGRTYDCMAHSDFLIVKSGTATLEAAVLGTPMIIIYRGSAIMRFEFLFRGSVLENFIGMPNIIADRGVCPEFINEHVTPEKMASVSLSLLGDEAAMAKMKSELRDIRARLGEPGAIERAARVLLEMSGLQ